MQPALDFKSILHGQNVLILISTRNLKQARSGDDERDPKEGRSYIRPSLTMEMPLFLRPLAAIPMISAAGVM